MRASKVGILIISLLFATGFRVSANVTDVNEMQNLAGHSRFADIEEDLAATLKTIKNRR